MQETLLTTKEAFLMDDEVVNLREEQERAEGDLRLRVGEVGSCTLDVWGFARHKYCEMRMSRKEVVN